MITRADRAVFPQWVAVDHGLVTRCGTGPAPTGAIDAADGVLVPGFVDLQVNGVGSDDLATSDLAGFRRVGAALAAAGVTAWCPTLITAPPDAYDDFLARVHAAAADASAQGLPTILGAHLEGPFLGGAPGAHDASLVRPADTAWLAARLDHQPGVVRIVTLGPEADPSGELIRMLVAHGVTVALGHTTATADAARAAVDAGASMATHLFNAMSGLHHRAPGVVGLVLDDARVTPTLIADGVHVDPVAMRVALAAKEQVAVVSDAVAVRAPLVARNDAAYLPDGTLAGATTLLDGAVRNLVQAGVPFTRAIECVSAVPALLIGATDRGALRVGARADAVLLDPDRLTVRATYVRGARV